MTNDTLKAARALTRALGETERCIEDSILTSAQLVVRILDARRATGAQAAESSRAVEDVIKSMRLAVEAQKALLSSHEKLAESRDKLGIPPQAAGCTTTCLPNVIGLRLVEPVRDAAS